MPTLKLEKILWREGYKYVAGLDEAGRGSLAGPIVGAAVIFGKLRVSAGGGSALGGKKNELRGIRDSKLLSPQKREKLFKSIIKNCLCWTTAKVNEKTIDKIGMAKANQLVFKKAIKKLKIKPDFILVDGRINLDSLKIPYLSIVDADAKIFSCSAASILAKVWRDNLMRKIAKRYPHYGFTQHKGYGTRRHYQKLRRYGPCPCHRKSFRLQ